jgi:hypothetical protein
LILNKEALMALEERFLSEVQLRNIVAKAKSTKLREGAEVLLSQMDGIREQGGCPACVLQADGAAFVFDATEMMGS